MPSDIWSSFDQFNQPQILKEAMEFISIMEDTQTEADILQQVMRYIGRFGATHVLAGSFPKFGLERRRQLDHIILGAWPSEWVSHYFRSGYVYHDPTIRMVREKHLPFFWRDIALRRLPSEATRIMGEARDFGLEDGFTFGLQTPDGATIGFSISGAHLEMDDRDRDRVTLLASIAVDRALQLKELDRNPPSMGVTPRERRALQLAADGLRENEIAVRMGISGHGANKHLRSVRAKLEARNTPNAIAIAMRLGLLR